MHLGKGLPRLGLELAPSCFNVLFQRPVISTGSPPNPAAGHCAHRCATYSMTDGKRQVKSLQERGRAHLSSVLVAVALISGITTPSFSQAEAQRGSGLLLPGDQIRLHIWREPDLSGDFQVGIAGKVVLPKLGEINVIGVTPDSLRTVLIHKYSPFLRNPAIEVTVLRRVNVLGAVRTPGLYPLDATMTVSDALALAGGATPDGKVDKVELRRDQRKLMIDLASRTPLSATPIQSGDQLFVPQKSWISRNGGIVLAAGITATTTVVAALLLAN